MADIAFSALAPAMASSSSCCALAAPLTPTAPMTVPWNSIGTPPCSGVKSFRATIEVRPFLMMSSKTFVGFLKMADVRAFPMEMFAPAANVLSRRSRAIRFPPSSTTAITPPGAFTLFASATAAAMTFFAPSNVRPFLSITCAWLVTATADSIRAAAIVRIHISSFLSFSAELLERRSTRFGDVLVLRGRLPAHANGADDFSFIRDGNAALQRRGAGKGQCRNAPVADLVFEHLARPAEDCRRPCLADADVDARNLGIVEPFEQEQVPAVVHDDDDHSRAFGFRIGFRCCCDFLRRGQGQRLLVHHLRMDRAGDHRNRQTRHEALPHRHDRVLLLLEHPGCRRRSSVETGKPGLHRCRFTLARVRFTDPSLKSASCRTLQRRPS